MIFRRKGRSKFVSGPFTIVRPSGRRVDREKFDLYAEDHDYNVRIDGARIWLLDGDEELAFAESGPEATWTLLFGSLRITMELPKAGVSHSVFYAGEAIFAQTRGAGFPMKTAELIEAEELSEVQRAFLVAVSLLAWRESDRSMIGVGSDAG